MGTDPRLSGRDCRESGLDSQYSYAADFGIDTETITYTLPGLPSFSRVLDRHERSFGRDTDWELRTTATPPVTDNNTTFTYSPTTGRLDTVASAAAGTFTYGYLADSNLIETITKQGNETLPAIVATRSWESSRDALAVIENKVGTTTRSAYDYSAVNGGVNSLGQRGGVATTFNLGGLAANPGNTSWGYDPLGQLTSAATPSPGNDRAYQYDTIANRRFAEKGAAIIPQTPGVNTTIYTPNALNQYAGSGAIAGALQASPAYDSDGNMTSGPLLPTGTTSPVTRTFVWDSENRLIEVQNDGEPVVTYSYDALSRRISRTAGGTTTLYLYDGWNCIAEYSGSTPALARTHTWGLDLSGTLQGAGGVGGLLAVKIGSTAYYPTYDGNGNISEYLNADGTAAAHFEYDPFGNTVVDTDSENKLFNYRFSTKPLDFLTGLYYYGYRWYDPVTGRWPSRDPIAESGGVNLYAFLSNGGLNRWDYLGTKLQQPGLSNPEIGVPLPPHLRYSAACSCIARGTCLCTLEDPSPIDLAACPDYLATGVAEAEHDDALSAGFNAYFQAKIMAEQREATEIARLCVRDCADSVRDSFECICEVSDTNTGKGMHYLPPEGLGRGQLLPFNEGR